MNRLKRQAVLFFLAPLALFVVAAGFYIGAGGLHRALNAGPAWYDWTLWVALALTGIISPVLGYRLTVRIADALAQSTEMVRRVAEGDFSRTLAAWASEISEMFDLEQGINATALRLQERLAELAEEKGRLEAILTHMAEGVLLLDARKRIVLINPAAEAMLGVRRSDVLGRDHLEVTHHFDLDQRLDRVLQSGEPEVLEIRRARPEEQIVEARLAPAGDAEESPRGVLVVMRDVTQQRQLERMRTEFVANVTHELRTPLTSIRGFAETLLEGALEDPEAARHFVGIIQRESDHLGHLVEDLLDLSRIESGKLKMRKELIRLDTLAAETVGRLKSKADSLGVALAIQIPESLPAISGDPDRLAQVLLNLVDNALKYTPAGGSVTVSAADAGTAVSVSVADTGVGIPKADLPRIFERFYRVDKARTRSTGGTGLGLSIVKHIVESHGGSISVVSDVGQGATFTFTLPKS